MGGPTFFTRMGPTYFYRRVPKKFREWARRLLVEGPNWRFIQEDQSTIFQIEAPPETNLFIQEALHFLHAGALAIFL